jgi:hypothetical protein
MLANKKPPVKMKIIYSLLILLSSISCLAQIKYEKGYFIDNDDRRIECFILSDSPKDNPTRIKYKISEEDEFLVAQISELKEFGVSKARYLRATVQLDKSSQNLKELTISRNPEWVELEIFLKVVVDGKADLFYYSGEELVLFFYRIDNSPIEQLIYKQYLTSNDKTNTTVTDQQKMTTTSFLYAAENHTYINQLNTQVTCNKLPLATLKNIKYSGDQLSKYFIKYNKCVEADFISYDDYFKNEFHLSLKPGMDYSTLKVDSYFGLVEDFPERQLSFRVGAEAEFTLPFKKGKWAVLVEPAYQSYNSTSKVQIDYKSIEIALGGRHYFFLGNDSKLFINIAGVIDLPIIYSIKFSNGQTFESKTIKGNYAVGLGYSYKKFSVEGRYYSLRTGVDETSLYYIDFKKSSLIIV